MVSALVEIISANKDSISCLGNKLGSVWKGKTKPPSFATADTVHIATHNQVKQHDFDYDCVILPMQVKITHTVMDYVTLRLLVNGMRYQIVTCRCTQNVQWVKQTNKLFISTCLNSFTSFCSSSSTSSSPARSLQCSATTWRTSCLRSSSPCTALPPSLSTHLSRGKQKANAGADINSVKDSDEVVPRTFTGTVWEWMMEMTRLVANNRSSSRHPGSMQHKGFKSLSVTYPTSSAVRKRKQDT